ncbi:hypothetical protein D3C84_1104180 [compost metagenome]
MLHGMGMLGVLPAGVFRRMAAGTGMAADELGGGPCITSPQDATRSEKQADKQIGRGYPASAAGRPSAHAHGRG